MGPWRTMGVAAPRTLGGARTQRAWEPVLRMPQGTWLTSPRRLGQRLRAPDLQHSPAFAAPASASLSLLLLIIPCWARSPLPATAAVQHALRAHLLATPHRPRSTPPPHAPHLTPRPILLSQRVELWAAPRRSLPQQVCQRSTPCEHAPRQHPICGSPRGPARACSRLLRRSALGRINRRGALCAAAPRRETRRGAPLQRAQAHLHQRSHLLKPPLTARDPI
jgi:hypothetical protein